MAHPVMELHAHCRTRAPSGRDLLSHGRPFERAALPQSRSLEHLSSFVSFVTFCSILLCSCTKLPPPPEGFILNETNSILMTGHDDPENERWCDILGNFYSTEFARNFGYESRRLHPYDVGSCV